MRSHLLLALFVIGAVTRPTWSDCSNVPCDFGQPGDFDNDGDVDTDDFAVFRQCQSQSDPQCSRTDLNGDGVTDSADFAIWQAHFTGSCDCAPILKEPLTQSLASDEPSLSLPQLDNLFFEYQKLPDSADEKALDAFARFPDAPDIHGPDPALPVSRIIDANSLYRVHGHSGELHLSLEDLRIRGRGLDLVWMRTYRSRTDINTAMGQGWDFSYNIYIEAAGAHIRLHNGQARSDVLLAQPNGTWVRREMFAILEKEAAGGFLLVFDNGIRWRFRPLDGSPVAGRIDRIADRNGNAQTFSYDGEGRLVTIHDTLDTTSHDRDLTIAYNPDGYIESISDFSGRKVNYRYYSDQDSAGGKGDLASTAGPHVTGQGDTPDAGDGITASYTYSRYASDERLNHNLLTIADAKGQIWLSNSYSSYDDAGDDLRFDRVVRQTYGGPSDRIASVYRRLQPSAENGWASIRSTMTDRAGNVGVFFYDVRNRLVMKRQYSGRAETDRVVDFEREENLPQRPLREGEPAYFETRYQYDEESLCTQIVRPEGDGEQFVYDSHNANPLMRGHLLEHVRQPGRLAADQPRLVETFDYHPQTGGLVRAIDPRGFETIYTYDDTGNCTRLQRALSASVEHFEYNAFGQMTAHIWPDHGGARRRRDEFSYYATGRQRGYLESQTLDVAELGLTTRWFYDRLGRITRITNPGGHDLYRAWSTRDKLVREISPELSPGSGSRVQRIYGYDPNGRLIEATTGQLDENEQAPPESLLSASFEYDLLGALIRQTRRVSLTATASVEYEYDRNHNRSLVRLGEAVNDRQPTNTITLLYDERDLPLRVIRAAGDPLQSTTQYDYDGDGHVRRIAEGIESLSPHVSQITYDGYGRVLRRTDPMGNEESYHYDPAGNLITSRFDGELNDQPGGASNVRMAESSYDYDEINRRTREVRKYFDVQTQTVLEDGEAVTRFEYTDTGLIARIIDDLGNTRTFAYDALGRCVNQRDARGNTITFTFDSDGNTVTVTDIGKSDLGRPDTVLTKRYEYDALGRTIRSVDAAGRVEKFAYDISGNRVLYTDARGHHRRYFFDNLGRRIQTIIDMNGNGAGATDAADIAISRKWDDSNRLIAETDANLNTTSYVYDPLGRRVATRFADGTAQVNTYDVFDCPVTAADAVGTITRNTFDRLNRITARSIARAIGVAGSTFENYLYDGRSRLVSGADDDSLITRRYDSLDHLLAEAQEAGGGTTRITSATYDSLGRRLSLRYPGGRLIAASYDPLGRPLAIRDETPGASSLVAAYSYTGRDRVEQRDFGNGVRMEAAYDGAGLPTTLRYVSIASGISMVTRAYGWDAAGNCAQIQASSGTGFDTRVYFYDAANRLVGSERPNASLSILYTLDGAGNRTSVAGGPDAGAYLLDPSSPEPADLQMNQYTAAPGVPRTYDRNGDLTTAGSTRRYSYDARAELTELTDLGAGLTVLYKYDVLGRRVEKNVGGIITRHYYFGDQEIEEQSPSNITIATFVHPINWPDSGRLVQCPLQMTRGAQRSYLLADLLGSCLALTNASGAAVELYDYADFGRPLVSDPSGSPLGASPAGNPFLFRGRRLDFESGLYLTNETGCAGARCYDPSTGRLLSRPELNPWSDPSRMGNTSVAWRANPLSP